MEDENADRVRKNRRHQQADQAKAIPTPVEHLVDRAQQSERQESRPTDYVGNHR